VSISASAQTLFWIGGQGNWNDTNHWSLESGGKSYGKIPELSNDVIFDRNSGSQKVDISINGLAKCNSIQAKLPIHFTGNGQILYKNKIDFSKIRFSKKIHFSQLENTLVRGSFTISVTSTNETCYGYCDGTITISISGTPTYPVSIRLYNPVDIQPPYVDYTNLNASDFPYTISNLCGSSNPFTVRVRDSDNDTQWQGNIYVLAPGQMIIADADTTNETCPGDCDGGIQINFIQNAAYPISSYQWTDGENSDNIVNKCAGTYSVTITDANSCVDTFDFPITAPPAISIDSTYYTPFICAGNTGQVYVEASGGTPPLSYDIGSGPQANGDFPGLSSGTYTVTVTDNNGCTNTAGPFDLQDNPAINISDTHNNVDCNGNCTGSIDVTVSGGNNPYTYSWTGPGGYSSTSEDLSNLCVGVYDLTVTDSVNCTETYSVTITEPAPLTITNDSTVDISCNGSGDGGIYITINGGTPPYTYSWTGPGTYASTNEDITNLEQGIYSVVVTDSNNCTATFSDTINEPLPIIVTTDSVQDISCNGLCNGAIYISVTNGTLPYTYNWTGPSGYTSTNEDISGLCAGDYDLTVTDANGCQQTSSETINEPPAINVTETHVNPTCNSSNNGSIDLTVSGGTPGYSFNWSTSDGSGLINGQEDQNNLTAGTYDVTVSDANGCQQPLSITLNDPSAIIITETHNNISCNSLTDGSIDLTVSGGTGPGTYVYNWSTPDGSGLVNGQEDQTGLGAGTYYVTVTDNGPCSAYDTITIIEPAGMSISIDNIQDITCNGQCNGSIDITVTGGTTPYTFDWQGPSGYSSTSEDISNLCAGTYYLTVTDSANCQKSDSATVTEPPILNVTETHVNPTCNSSNNGSIDLTVSGGTPGYNFNWSTADGSGLINGQEDQNNLTAGTYDVTVSDANSCQQTLSITLNDPSAIIITETHNNISCNGLSDGSIDLTVSGGTGPGTYVYNWSTPDGSGLVNGQEDQTGLGAGTYYVTVTDNGPCSAYDTITIIEPAGMSISIDNIQDVTCNGQCDGSIDITVTGGTPGYSFDWQGPSGYSSTSEDLSNLCAGTYNLTVTDSAGCQKSDSATVNEPTIITVAFDTVKDVSCNGLCNGQINISVSGGTPGYSYSWSGPSGFTSTAEDISGLCAGTYYLTVIDLAGCQQTDSTTINEPPVITITTDSINDVSCNGLCDGEIYVTVSGGTPGYDYNWSNGGPNAPSLTGLCAGTYYLTVTDAANCSKTDSFTVSEPPALTIAIDNITNVKCNSGTDGAVDISVGGGTPGYTYNWTGPGTYASTNEDISGLQAGTYYVTATDNNGCQITDSATVTEPQPIVITIDSTQDVLCNGGSSGYIYITVTDGTTPYSYSWTGPGPFTSTNEDITGLAAGTYNLIVTDSNNCTQNTSIVINEPSALIGIISNYSEPQCNGECTGQATVTALGGTPSYTYSWSTGGNGMIENGLCAGQVVVTVTDAHGCTVSDSVTLTEPPVLNVNILGSNNPQCYGSCDGSITISANGGTGPYIYSWFDGATGNIHNSLCAGTFQFTVTDAHNCTASDSATLTDPLPITATITINNQPTCFGVCDGSITVNPSGGTGSFSYNWSSGETNQTASLLCAGPDSVTVTDANNCTAAFDTVLIAPVVVTIHVDTVINPLCYGDCNGSATVSASGGTNPLSFLWSTGNTNLTENNLCDSIYSVTVTDNNGCQDTTSVHPIAPVALWDTLQYIPPSCNGDTDATAWVVDSGGTTPYTYQWSNSSTNDTISNIGAGDYIVTISDAHNCSLSDTITVVEPLVLSYLIISQTDPLCYNDCNGGITIQASGGTSPYSYNWSDGNTSFSDTNLCAGTYYFTITDSSGCTITDSITLNNPPLLTSNMVDSNRVSCYGLCDGYAVVSGLGGTPPYAFLWDANAGNQIVDSAINLCVGQYFVTVTDTNGCQAIDSILITQPDSIIVTVDTVTEAYCGGCVGSIAISVTGGTSPYSYLWSGTAQTSDSITGLCPNIYFVTVTDTNGCTQINSAEVTDTSDLNLTFSNVHNVSCNGLCDATATASVTGGYPPYTFIWSEGTTDSVASGLCADTFYVTVTDTASCSRVGMIIINQSDVLSATDSSNNISCHGLTDGSIYLHPTGGTQPYSVVWNNGSTDTILTGLGPGYYTYTLTDSNACTYVDSIEIIDPPQLTDSLFVIDSIACNGYNNGIIGVIPSGGTLPYGYSWTDLTTDSIDSELVAGTYYLTLTDTNGCFIVDSMILTQPDSLSGNFVSVNSPPCGGVCSGSATIMLNGGTLPYSYTWSNGDTTAMADSMCVDIFVVTVTDAQNCQFVDSIIMQDTSTLNLVLDTIISPTCYGDCNGQAIVSASGGYPGATSPYYTYQWDANAGSQVTDSATNLCAGNYVVTVTDDSLCSRLLPVSVTQPDSITIQLTDTNLFTCYGDSSGSITVMVSGGTPGYSYLWDNGQTDSVATGLSGGIHTVTVTDTLGCVQTLDTVVNTNAEIVDSMVITNSLCENNINDGKIDLFVSGGTPGYTYLWSTGDTIQNLDSLFGGWYSVMITDTLGCNKIDSGLISGSIIVTARADTDTVICPGDSVQIFGSGSDIFVWKPTSYMSDSTIKNPIVFPPLTTTYYFTAYDSICFDTDSVLIQVYPEININAGEDVEIMYNHPTQLEVTGGDTTCTYLWVPSDGLDNDTIANPMANPEQTTTYYVFATNSNGCMFADSVKVTVIPQLIIPNGITPNGDGINDIWMIDNISRFPNCEVFIFNRWGEQLFYSKGYPDDERWDGTYKGKKLPTGTYYFVINLHDNIITEPISGPITIVR